MTFAGISNEKQRADVIAYLNSLSANPVPLPKAPALNKRRRQLVGAKSPVRASPRRGAKAARRAGRGFRRAYPPAGCSSAGFGAPHTGTLASAIRNADNGVIERSIIAVIALALAHYRLSRNCIGGPGELPIPVEIRIARVRRARPSFAGLDQPARWRKCLLQRARRGDWRHGTSLFGDLKYPAGLQAIRLRQCQSAEGRRGAADRASAPSTISTR